jgi:7-cyano-7-deazaguanine reductase
MTPNTPPTSADQGLDHAPLGRESAYPTHYAPELLCPLPRAPKRHEIGIEGAPLFMGADLWTAYELSWLNPKGKPQVAVALITVPAETPHIIESKSFKLYLNSFNATVMPDAQAVQERMRADIAQALWRGAAQVGSVGVQVLDVHSHDRRWFVQPLEGLSLDRLDIECTHYEPAPELLQADASQPPVQEVLVSDLLKSNCLVTGQPDWGSVQIAYTGAPIDQAGLLRYLVSFRNHNEFHEQCVERIYMDIWRRCQPQRLSVYARYTRRGGLDINPFRTSHPQALPSLVRTPRQ